MDPASGLSAASYGAAQVCLLLLATEVAIDRYDSSIDHGIDATVIATMHGCADATHDATPPLSIY